ncbi:MAG: single-stranded-DNA-specific exonuclease RecJ, partial [Arenimonas sp.]|uniref:single-stranded-DNA-specific exonuclease RecJ n=1 Tax=Arenimonas sp. TaxID=1872635 RepID=UPI003C0DA6B3
MARIHAARGISHPTQADLSLQHLLPPDSMGGLDDAVALVLDAISRQLRIVIVGDFDCDGATGTAVAVRGLRMLGAQNVFFKVPHRVRHGYGLTPGLVEDLAELKPDLIITVDSGIACNAGVAAANARGYRVLVTDHHLPGDVLPPAAAILNPNQPGCAFASKSLAGVGVIFYLLLAVRREMRHQGGGRADLSSLLDLVAIGTIADMVRLDANNRRLVRAGLSRINTGRCQPGVAALASVGGLEPGKIDALAVGFRIGPKINAAGRLEDMALGIECLLTNEPAQAMDMAQSLHAINLERQHLQQEMLDDAERVIGAVNLEPLPNSNCLILHQSDWHPGIIGLLASRMKDRLHRPVLVFAPSEPGSAELRGSCRSIPGFHMRDALALVDARHPGLISRFGGHAMAAGLTLAGENLGDFTRAFQTVASETLDPDLLQEIILTDGPLQPGQLSRATAEMLMHAGPWGQGFPVPTFDNVFDVIGWQILKDKHLKLQLR